jgi:excinuclease ABC subunit A
MKHLYVKIHGKHIGELCNMQVSHLKDWFDAIQWSEQEQAIGKRILLEDTSTN